MNPIPERTEAISAGRKRYFTGNPCKNNHIDERYVSNRQCVTCERNRMREKRKDNPHLNEKERAHGRRYRERPEIKERDKINYLSNKKYISTRTANWKRIKYQSDPDFRGRSIEANKKYRESRKGKATEAKRKELGKPERNRQIRDRYKKDPEFRMKKVCQDMLRRTLMMSGSKKEKRTLEATGYSADRLRDHLEIQFLKGMTWENYGEWHIDHIIPISLMISEGETDPRKINCLSNLRPMWARDNLSKGDKAETLL